MKFWVWLTSKFRAWLLLTRGWCVGRLMLWGLQLTRGNKQIVLMRFCFSSSSFEFTPVELLLVGCCRLKLYWIWSFVELWFHFFDSTSHSVLWSFASLSKQASIYTYLLVYTWAMWVNVDFMLWFARGLNCSHTHIHKNHWVFQFLLNFKSFLYSIL